VKPNRRRQTVSATREYAVIRARVGNGNPVAVHLIDAEELQEFPNLADYFPPGTRDVQEVGRIQVMGDTHLLGMMYDESL
jgi:hypothetical protein